MPPSTRSTAGARFHIHAALAELRYIRAPAHSGVVANITQRLGLALADLSAAGDPRQRSTREIQSVAAEPNVGE